MTAFSHLDAGTPEEVWRADQRIDTAPPLEVDLDELVVVAAHPDDETLGAAGLIRRVHCSGGGITVVVATDGEASHPNSPSHARTDLGSIRRGEVRRAVHTLAPGARVHFLGLPDGELRENAGSLEASLSTVLDALPAAGSRTLLVAPWSGDGHRDHRVTAEAVARLAGQRGIPHLGYPIWLWHWGRPDDVPWQDGLALALSPGERSIKARALRSHVSQTQPLSPAAGDQAIVPASMQAHFDRDTELYFREAGTASVSAEESVPGATCDPRAAGPDDTATEPAKTEPVTPRPAETGPADTATEPAKTEPARTPPEEIDPETRGATLPTSFFDDFYARHDDPWGFETRWYEERKRAIVLASLPSRWLGRVLEIGCATGLLTREFAARAASVYALDASAAALDAARARVAGDEVVTLHRGAVPADWPEGEFDTIVLSEVGYYLSTDDLARTIGLMDSALAADGCVIACHWRHPVAEYPLSGDEVHRALRSFAEWDALVRHVEEDFVLEVFGRRPAASVARREGLA